VAWPFYKGAWNSLKQKQFSIDLPMAVASLAGFIFSSIQLLRGYHDIYFDSLSGFLFLILLARYFQRRLQNKLLRSEEVSEILELEKVRKVVEGGWNWRPLSSIKVGDSILLQASETLPADAELVSSRAHFSMAWLSGESRSRTFLMGAVVPAGSRLVSGEVQLQVKKNLNETGFGKILSEVQKFSLSRNNLVSLSDKWAQGLLLVVFSIAFVFLISYWQVSPEESIRRSLALIILACPCALAFGTPLALATGLRKSQKNSLIVRNANVFEKAKNIKTIFFDKTGTLTDTDLSLREAVNDIPTVYQKIILSLENESMHPIAFAFRKAFDNRDSLPPVDGLREIPGQGVSGFIYGKFYELRNNSISRREVSCTLFEDLHPIYSFSFEAELKPEALSVIEELRNRNYRVVLLSGDQSDSVDRIAKKLKFEPQDVISQASPEDKLRHITQTPLSMMIGDGVNDSLAMMKAQVSVAATGGVEMAIRNTDVYLATPSLLGVLKLLDISAATLKLNRTNLILSAVYNVAGGILALMGFIDPFVAALLMPLSSGALVLNTWWRSKK
jgi:Cu2+-exporting ATPase/Cu+-exporting ATPase